MTCRKQTQRDHPPARRRFWKKKGLFFNLKNTTFWRLKCFKKVRIFCLRAFGRPLGSFSISHLRSLGLNKEKIPFGNELHKIVSWKSKATILVLECTFQNWFKNCKEDLFESKLLILQDPHRKRGNIASPCSVFCWSFE